MMKLEKSLKKITKWNKKEKKNQIAALKKRKILPCNKKEIKTAA